MRKDDNGHQQLEDDNHPPVPLAERLGMLGAGVVDPVCDEGADTVEHLPEGHDLATDLWRSKLADVDGAGSKSQTLTDTDDDTTTDEGAKVAARSESLNQGCDDDHNGTGSHTDTTTGVVSKRSTHEPPSHDGTDGVGGIDGTNLLSVLLDRSATSVTQGGHQIQRTGLLK